jgi:hypothetical protein
VANGRAVRRGGGCLWATGALAGLTVAWTAVAQEGEGHRGQMVLAYQDSEAQNLAGTDVTIPTSPIKIRLFDFAVDYALNDRWSISAGLPLISRSFFDPNRGHDPLRIIPPHTESEFIDDGSFTPTGRICGSARAISR